MTWNVTAVRPTGHYRRLSSLRLRTRPCQALTTPVACVDPLGDDDESDLELAIALSLLPAEPGRASWAPDTGARCDEEGGPLYSATAPDAVSLAGGRVRESLALEESIEMRTGLDDGLRTAGGLATGCAARPIEPWDGSDVLAGGLRAFGRVPRPCCGRRRDCRSRAVGVAGPADPAQALRGLQPARRRRTDSP